MTKKKKKERSSAPRLGQTYQAVKLGASVAFGPGYAAIKERSAENVITRITGRDGNFAYAKGVAVSLADQWGSKKIGHAAALSRRSITAWAPEVEVGLRASGNLAWAKDDPIGVVMNVNTDFTGYDTRAHTFDVGRPIRYGAIKYGLGIGRKVVNKTRIAQPLKKALGMMGVTL